MYSQQVIKSKLQIAQKQIDSLPKSQQFSLTYYTLHDSITITQQIESKWQWENQDKEIGNYVGLSKPELQFIQNERIISANNFLYWARRYPLVTHFYGHGLVHFNPFKAQKIIVSIWGEMEEQELAIMCIQLKARQLGASTLTELAIAHRVQFLTRRNALVASSDPTKSRKMAMMMGRAWSNQPHFMQSKYDTYESGELFAHFEKTDHQGKDASSSVTVQHGNRLSGIARGDTVTDAHISELPDFSNAAEHIDASLINAMHENPEMFLVLESTAKGKGNWWHRTWEANVEGLQTGDNKLYPIFLPWFMGTEIYPTETELRRILKRKQVKLEEWKPNKRTIAHAQKCARYVRDTPYISKVLGKNWKLPKRQQFFWEHEYNLFKKKDDLPTFYEERPATPSEAFQASGRPIFDPEFIQELHDYSHDLASYQGKPATFKLIGYDVPEDFEPTTDEIDLDRAPIKIVADWAYGKYRHEYMFIPVHHDPTKWQNKILIYEFPFADGNLEQKYANGIDCSAGVEADNTVLETIKKGTFSKPAQQVLEFASPNLSATALYPWAEAIGTYYSHVTDEIFNQCRQAIEVQFGGNDLQYTFIKTGWSNFHEWEGSYDNALRRTIHKLGWETNYWARGMLIAKSRKAILDWYLRVHSPYAIEELGDFQKGDDTDRIEAGDGAKDDRVLALFIAYFSLHVKELYNADLGSMASNLLSFKPTRGTDDQIVKTPEQLRMDEREKLLEELNSRGHVMNTTLPFPDSRDQEGLIYTRASDTNRY